MMEFVSWDDEIPIYYGKNKKFSKPPTFFLGGQYDGYLDAAVEKKNNSFNGTSSFAAAPSNGDWTLALDRGRSPDGSSSAKLEPDSPANLIKVPTNQPTSQPIKQHRRQVDSTTITKFTTNQTAQNKQLHGDSHSTASCQANIPLWIPKICSVDSSGTTKTLKSIDLIFQVGRA
jgi:hypothetical protein